MAIEKVEETINVVASFTNGKIKPLLFSLRGRRYKDLRVHSTWNMRFGGVERIFFTVSPGNDTDVYEIYFDTKYLNWVLSKVVAKF